MEHFAEELLALVQTYRLHQASIYRWEKYRIAVRLAEFNQRLLEALKRQLQANQISAADLVLAEVENQTTLQHVETALQEFVAAKMELCQQIGVPRLADAVELAGTLQAPDYREPDEEGALVRTALESRPEIRALRAQVAGSHDAVLLARAERIPIPSIGPIYEKDESNVSFYGVGTKQPDSDSKRRNADGPPTGIGISPRRGKPGANQTESRASGKDGFNPLQRGTAIVESDQRHHRSAARAGRQDGSAIRGRTSGFGKIFSSPPAFNRGREHQA